VAIADVLPFRSSAFAWMFRYMNAALRIHNRISRLTQRDDIVITDVTIPGTEGADIPAVYLRPKDIEPEAPLLVYYHGGGFALTYAFLHLQMCKQYAGETRCSVLLPDYRLMPAYRWPCGFNDSFRTLEWALHEAGALRIDPRRVVVGGDSAGGALAAGVAQKAKDLNIPLAGQMLIYPMLDSQGTTWSVNEYKATPLWTSRTNRNTWEMYLGLHSREAPPAYAAPGLRQSLAELPSAYVETAEFDPLHDEGVNYAKALQQAGVAVELNETRGTYHGFEVASKSRLVAQSISRRIAFLQSQIA
jgi:acetyl esterase/lipase